MTVIAALRKWVEETEANAKGGEIPACIASSYIAVKEALEEYDRGEIEWTDGDRALLRSLRIAA